MTVKLREVGDGDRPIFFDHRLEPLATRSAAFLSRDGGVRGALGRDPGDKPVVARTILHNGQLVSHVVSFVQCGESEISYWLGQAHWGQGLATQVLAASLGESAERQLYAHVAKFDLASRRMLEEFGLRVVGEGPTFSTVGRMRIDGPVLRLQPRLWNLAAHRSNAGCSLQWGRRIQLLCSAAAAGGDSQSGGSTRRIGRRDLWEVRRPGVYSRSELAGAVIVREREGPSAMIEWRPADAAQ